MKRKIVVEGCDGEKAAFEQASRELGDDWTPVYAESIGIRECWEVTALEACKSSESTCNCGACRQYYALLAKAKL